MFALQWFRRIVTVLACAFSLSYSFVSIADDVVSFSTGGTPVAFGPRS